MMVVSFFRSFELENSMRRSFIIMVKQRISFIEVSQSAPSAILLPFPLYLSLLKSAAFRLIGPKKEKLEKVKGLL